MTTWIILAIALVVVWYILRKRGVTINAANPNVQSRKPYLTISNGLQSSTREDRYTWRNFGRDLDRLESALKEFQYRGIFEPSALDISVAGIQHIFDDFDLPHGALALERINSVLSDKALAPPHGLDLFQPIPSPECPALPKMPDRSLMREHETYLIHRYDDLEADLKTKRAAYAAKANEEAKLTAKLAIECRAGDAKALTVLMRTTLARHPLPTPLRLGSAFALDVGSRIALCTIEVPDFSRLPIVNKRGKSYTAKWLPVSEAEKRRASERVLHSLCVRAAYLIAMSDPANLFDTVAVNAHQAWFDPATGASRDGIIASLQALKAVVKQLQPGHLDAKACFRHLAGISTPNSLNSTPIRPIFILDTDDNRVIPNKDVASGLEQEANLATMPWEDFEHLVRQLFEWMFTSDGIEVKVTRASRDRGVDAIMFDPDPVRGGKYVLQAKRYTRTVDVAAVRDLYGTIVNEGANRGILVTTATYGPDAYEFAKNKPISLIDGPNLISLLRKHGRNYRVDLEEARKLEAATRNDALSS